MRLTGQEIAKASQGAWKSDVPNMITGIGTDSRDFIAGHAFLALRGITFDGHGHAHQVVEQASALIGDGKGVGLWAELTDTPQLEVNDTLHALGDIAACHRKKLIDTQVIAITGSYGKTTVRSMLAHVLKALGLEVASTKENFNNLIGVPKTLMAVQPSADVAIIECGISELGEMERLSGIVQPDIAIVTGLTHAHSEGLGGMLGVAREKSKLMTHLLAQGWCVLGHGVSEHFKQADCSVLQTTYDMDKPEAVSWVLNGMRITLKHGAETSDFDLILPAKHWAEDMALVATTVLKLAGELQKNWSLDDITQTLSTWVAVDGRMRVYAPTAEKKFTLIDDSYNANPASMQAALDTLALLDGHKVAIIGDMLELGEQAEVNHLNLDLHGIDEVIVVGDLMSSLAQQNGIQSNHCFRNAEDLMVWLDETSEFPAFESKVLLKSSHGMGLYKVAEQLKQRGQHVI
ncbi:MAG: UDP-N-acetylmuramoyl-tripeptide--D-alanyl-D-alanine ligase [Ghiorsea sp.]